MKKILSLVLVIMMLLPTLALAEWDGTITVVQSNDLINFDPIASTDTSNKNIIKNCMNRLFETDDMFNPVPILVKEYSVDESGLVWTIKIHDTIKFFNGKTCTVDDVMFCLWRSKNGSSSGKTLLAPVAEMTKVDDYTFTITTSSTYPSLPTALSNSSTAIFDREFIAEIEAGNKTWFDMCSAGGGATGRYVLEERVIGDRAVLAKYDEYWNPDDAAKNEKLIFKIVPEGNTRTIMVQTGEADLNVFFDTATYDDIKDDKNVKLNSHLSSDTYYIAPNTVKGPFSNLKVRQALNYVINREDCLEVGANGHGNITYAIYPEMVYGYTPNPGNFEHSIEKAQALLAETEYAAGFNCVGVVKSDVEERVAQVVQAYLQMLNINMEIKRIDNTVMTETAKEGNFDLLFDHSAFYQDPALFLGRQFHKDGIGAKNLSHYHNDKVDELMKAASATFVQEERNEIYAQIHEIIVTECAWVPLYVGTMYNLAGANVEDALLNVETTYDYYRIYKTN